MFFSVSVGRYSNGFLIIYNVENMAEIGDLIDAVASPRLAALCEAPAAGDRH